MDSKARRYLLTGTVAVLFAALPVLAILQYRWIRDASRGEVERTRASLHRSAEQAAAEFNAEIVRLAATMFAATNDLNPRVYADRFLQWTSATRHPGIAGALLVTEGGQQGVDRVLRFDASSLELRDAAWPAELEPLRKSLIVRVRSQMPAGAGPPGVREDLPVLVSPRLHPRERAPEGSRLPRPGPGPQRWEPGPGPPPGRGAGMPGWRFGPPLVEGRAPADPGPDGWAIVWLDLEYFRIVWGPELHRRFFNAAGQGGYATRVVSAVSGKVLFDSDDPAEREASDKPDAEADMFDIRPAAFAGIRSPAADAEQANAARPRSRWRIQARERAGSVEASVARTRRLDFAIGAGVLLTMAAGALALLFALRRSEQLSRQQMQFVAAVSHELRTPLAVIRSAAENLADGIVKNEDAVLEYGSVILDQGRRLSYMVEQTLRFAGIQTGRARYNLAPADMTAVVDEAIRSCDGVIRDAGCTVERSIENDLPPVLGDHSSLVVSIGNLLTNAAKHARDGGWIGVRVSRSGERVRVEVSDRGPGIDHRDLPHLFEPFYRGRTAEARQTSGAGLGLALVRQIVEAHHGDVTVVSGPGKGACFTLSLPTAGKDS